MVDLPAATLPRPAAASTTPSRDRHPPCQARGGDALPPTSSAMAAAISLQRHFLSHRWRHRRAPCLGLRAGHRLQWQRVPRAGGWRHSGNTSPAPRGWACRCSSSTSTSPQSSASSRRCGRPGCSAPSGPTSSPPALGRGTRAVRAGPPRRALVCQPHVCCAHWPRLQGRSLLWKTGSWHLNVCYPWAVSWTSGCDAHEQTPSLLGGLGDIGTGLDALAGDIGTGLYTLWSTLLCIAFDETVVGCSVSLCSRLLAVYRIANSDGVSLGLMG